MNEAEEITAAIAKLTGERERADYQEVNGWLVEVPEGSRSTWTDRYDDPRTPLTNDPVMVTLYRTIDAQLGLLATALEAAHDHEHSLSALEWRNILALARAINGDGEETK